MVMADVLLGGIVINEVLVDPNGTINFDTDGNGTANDTDEYVELYNSSTTAIDISGVQLWDAGVGNYFTFPTGTILQPGAHAMVLTGISSGGSLPTGAADDLFFSAGRGSAVINNGGDTVIVYAPSSDQYIAATFNGATQVDPVTSISGFSATATQSGSGEDFGNDTDGQSLQRSGDGSNTFVSDTPTPGTTNICFADGTYIATPSGQVRVECLRPGDLVTTLDHGRQAVRWILAKPWTGAQVATIPALAPVLIAKGALGPGLPQRDLRVSQQHRILVCGAIARRMFGVCEVLVAAKHLTDLPGIHLDPRPRPVTYFHIMLDNHEVLVAEGVPAESLYLGSEALQSIPASGLQEIEQLTGQSIADLRAMMWPRARPFAKGKRAKALVLRHRKNGHSVLGHRVSTQP